MESLRVEASQAIVKIGENGRVKLCFEIDFEELSQRVSALKGGQVNAAAAMEKVLPGEQRGAPAPWASRNSQASASKPRSQSERDCALGWDAPLFTRQPNWGDFWSRARPQLVGQDIEQNRLRVQMLLDLEARRNTSSAVAQ